MLGGGLTPRPLGLSGGTVGLAMSSRVQVRWQQLDRHRALEAGVTGLIDDTHAATAELTDGERGGSGTSQARVPAWGLCVRSWSPLSAHLNSLKSYTRCVSFSAQVPMVMCLRGAGVTRT